MEASNWLWLAIAAGVIAVIYGVVSMMSILRLPTGNARMQEIAAAIQAGAKAYLNRQYTTIAIVGVVLFAVIGFSRIELWQAMSANHWTLFGVEIGHNYDITNVNGVPMVHLGQHLPLAFTVAFSLLGVVLFGTLVGSMLPFIFRRMGFDPASASAPFIATFVDVTGLIIYFNIALHILLR